MEIFVVICVLIFMWFIFTKSDSNNSDYQYSDEELKAMTMDERKQLVQEDIDSLKTQPLRILCRQYRDMNVRIKAGHPETLEGLDDQSIERTAERLKMMEEELEKRGDPV